MKHHPFVHEAVDALCQRFEDGEYNPTPLFELAALVVCADGVVDPPEIEVLQEILEPMLHAQLNQELVGYLIAASLKVIEAAGVEARVRLLAEILLDCDAVEEALTVAYALAYSGSGVRDVENARIGALARAVGYPEGRLAGLRERVRLAAE